MLSSTYRAKRSTVAFNHGCVEPYTGVLHACSLQPSSNDDSASGGVFAGWGRYAGGGDHVPIRGGRSLLLLADVRENQRYVP